MSSGTIPNWPPIADTHRLLASCCHERVHSLISFRQHPLPYLPSFPSFVPPFLHSFRYVQAARRTPECQRAARRGLCASARVLRVRPTRFGLQLIVCELDALPGCGLGVPPFHSPTPPRFLSLPILVSFTVIAFISIPHSPFIFTHC